jgi:hypothetical protein
MWWYEFIKLHMDHREKFEDEEKRREGQNMERGPDI